MTTKNIPEFDWNRLKEIREEIENEPYNEDELKTISAEELLKRVENGDSHYCTKGGVEALRRYVNEQKCKKQ